MTQASKYKPATRNKKPKTRVMFSTLIYPEKYRSLRLLSAQTNIEIKELIDEALDLLFAKHADSIPSIPRLPRRG